MIELPLPRLVTARPVYDIGDKPEVSFEPGAPGGLFGLITGRRQVVQRSGKPTIRRRPGGAKALWEIPGFEGEYRNRKTAMRERRRLTRLANSANPAHMKIYASMVSMGQALAGQARDDLELAQKAAARF